MIKEHTGDIFAPDNQPLWDAVAHQVNARGAFGKGFAASLARAFPEARQAYLRAHRKHGWQLGQILPIQVGPDRWVIHVCGQDDYGSGGPHTDYQALREGLQKVYQFTEKRNLRVALPRLGSGRAGGDWEPVRSIIASVWDDSRVLVFSLDEDRAGGGS